MTALDALASSPASVPIRRRLLITGHPRAGTGYCAAVARACGLDVGHEVMGADGVSSWLMGPPVWRVPFHRNWGHRGRLWYAFEQAVVVVRDPLPHIASVAFTESGPSPDTQTSLWWRAAWVPLEIGEMADPVAQAVQSIVGWRECLREWLPAARVVRMEEARWRIPEVVGVASPVADPGVINARAHDRLEWGDVRERCSPQLWRMLEAYRRECGYS